MPHGHWYCREETFPALIIKGYKMTCDVCGETVLRNEDATHLEAIVYNSGASVLVGSPRHILCSPSRGQYVVHDDFEEVLDRREAYSKWKLPEKMRLEREKKWTDAWVRLQNKEI
jgi:hypothetical protein